MPLRLYRCPDCDYEMKRFDKKSEPKLSPYCVRCYTNEECMTRTKKVIGAPSAKFMEKTDVNKNMSNMVGQQKELLERSRNHSRDHGLDDLIQENESKIAKDNNWLVENSNGSLRKRRKIDDI